MFIHDTARFIVFIAINFMLTNTPLSFAAIITEPHLTETKASAGNRKVRISLEHGPQDYGRHLAVMKYAVIVLSREILSRETPADELGQKKEVFEKENNV